MVDILIDPDGTLGYEIGVLIIVHAPTGVIYHHQCGGHATLDNQAEGFLIPVAGSNAARQISAWFWKEFKGNCYDGRSDWSPFRVVQLRQLVSEIPIWSHSGAESRRTFLELDEDRLIQCVEAWIPVRTPFGPGTMILANSD